MRFGILGPLEVVGDDRASCTPTALRQRRLLLALLVGREGAVSIDRLVDVVWPDGVEPPHDPAATIRTYVARLRGLLEPDRVGGEPRVLAGGPDRYRLVLDGHELDAALFEDELSAASDAMEDDPSAALRCVDQALARWRGQALEEVADESWAQPEAVRLDELRVAAQELRFRCLLDVGRSDEVVGELERHVREHPLRERAHGQLMLALHRAGRAAEATEVYRRFRTRLVDEAGLDPSPELQRLHERLLDPPGGEHLHGIATAGVWNELPARRTPLIGREEQLDVVTDLLGSTRVLTLTGVGGVGKTRLALAAAHAARDAGRHTVFVDLAPVTGADDVVDAAFSALRLPAAARGDHVDGLVRLLRAHPAVLVLDNCEHVLEAVAALVDRVSDDCPDLTVLVTSREPLGVAGEHVHRVPSLDPRAGVELFRSRAVAAAATDTAADIGPDAFQSGEVEEVCRRLDGIPLAIELAAARVTHMSVSAIVKRLDERFWLLTGGRRALGRHQTLQATMDWSYDLLDEEDRAVLRAAAVFVGSFDADALAAVAEVDGRAVLDRLGSLVASSLVEVERRGDETHYRLLETVRLYAQERLVAAGDAEVRRRAHAAHYLARAVQHPPQLTEGSRWGLWGLADGTERDLGNHLAAMDRFEQEGRLGDVGRIASRIPTVLGHGGFVDTSGRYLGREDVTAALDDEAERALYLTASAGNASLLGRFREQLALGEAAMAAATDPLTRAAAVVYAANACSVFDPERIAGLVAEALEDVPETASTLRQGLLRQVPLGMIMEGRLAEAVGSLDELVRDGGGFPAAELMLVHHLLGQRERALAVSAPGDLEPDERLWDYRWALTRALVAASDGREEEAWRWLADSAARIRSSPIALLDRDVLVGCAALAFHAGEVRRASELLAVTRGRMRSPASFALYLRYRDLVREQLQPEERHRIVERAAALDAGRVLEEELARRTAAPIG